MRTPGKPANAGFYFPERCLPFISILYRGRTPTNTEVPAKRGKTTQPSADGAAGNRAAPPCALLSVAQQRKRCLLICDLRLLPPRVRAQYQVLAPAGWLGTLPRTLPSSQTAHPARKISPLLGPSGLRWAASSSKD
ncbi:PREDICTED: uncharacterized protein LOC102013792 isoform X2 [Chinchilla lanigera]|uniref:uncharacterized protein LOC102013792 isoform X2 n=1 Tax=Chinchilla lanigera TaxID=34839 RepID=UPI000696B803|nr:PREDICTED: uncharacterized protein LOC102013792 isoform X2 [Chinchilla lanigera]